MPGCSAPNCTNSGAKGFVLVRFPRDVKIREEWRKATQRQNWNPTPANRLCEEHFKLQDWKKYKSTLKAEIIPSVFCDCHDNAENETPALSSRGLEHTYAGSQKPPKNSPVLGDISNYHNYCSDRPVQRSTVLSGVKKKRNSSNHTADCSIAVNRKSTMRLLQPEVKASQQEPIGDGAVMDQSDEGGVRFEVAQHEPVGDGAVMDQSEEGDVPVRAEVAQHEPVDEGGVMDQLEKENVRLRKRIQFLKKQLAQVKKERNDIKTEKRKLMKVAERETKRAKTAEEKHQELSQLLNGRFSKAQLEVAKGGKAQGRKWDEESVKIALKVKCAGGATGLKAASDLLMPLPSARTLRQKISHIKFEPGVQHEVLEDFALSLKNKPEHWRDSLLFFDDMSIKPGRQYDKGSDHYIGGITLPGVTGDACKAQVHMFGGVAQNWKVVGAYHFVSEESNAHSVATVIVELLKKAKEIGLNVIGIVCDMGNRPVLKALGFRTLKDDIIYSIPNPADPENVLFGIPDLIHLYKSTKECVSNNRIIELPSDVVQLYQLPSPYVEVEHIEWLCLYEEDMLVKFDSRLSMNDLHCKHFQKMKVAPATHVLSEKTASSLDFLVETGEACANATTTAWFLRLMANWKKIVTSRTRQLALSRHNMEEYNSAIGILRLVIHVFQNMKVKGTSNPQNTKNKGSSNHTWKPIQTHIIMATIAILELQEYLLTQRKYDFVLVGRFLQDIVENLFSLIRAVRPNPTALELKYRLREIVLSQFSYYFFKSSYGQDDRVDMLSNLLKPRDFVEAPLTLPVPKLPNWMDPPETFLSISERNALYRMSGYAVRSLVESKQIKCENCLETLKSQTHQYSRWTVLTNYKEGAQVEVSDEVYRLFWSLEFNLQRWRPFFDIMKSSFAAALEEPLKRIDSSLPKCHDISYKILKKYAVMRLKQFSAESKPSAKVGSSFGSRSMGSRLLADRF